MSHIKSPYGIAAAICAVFLAGCGTVRPVYFAEDGGSWVEISKAQYDAAQAGAPQAAGPAAAPGLSATDVQVIDPDGSLSAAIARNPNAMRTDRKLDFNPDGSPPSAEQIADVSLEIALELCNIPPGTPLTSATPCNIKP